MNPQDYIGKMYQVNFSGRHKEFVIISEIVLGVPSYYATVFWQNTLKYETYSLAGILRRISLGEWVEV